jgi:hypothetical protein
MTNGAFTYKRIRYAAPTLPLNRPPKTVPIIDPEPLIGIVHGSQASDIEERFARALDKAGHDFSFQVPVSVSGEANARLLDFAIDLGMIQPVEVDGLFRHSTAAQRGSDKVREIQLNQVFRQWGWKPILRIPYWKLATQALADRAVQELF